MTRSYKRYRGGRAGNGLRRLLTAVLAVLLLGVLTFAGLLTGVLVGDHDELQGEPGIMVILGCQVMPSGQPSVLLRDRLDTAIEYLQEHHELMVVVSGGQGENEPMTEAYAMAQYLMKHGIQEDRILLEERSHNTYQNLLYTRDLLMESGYDAVQDMIVVSSGFHLTRVRMLWGRVYGENDRLSTLAAPASHLPSRLHMYIREPLALAKSFLFDRG